MVVLGWLYCGSMALFWFVLWVCGGSGGCSVCGCCLWWRVCVLLVGDLLRWFGGWVCCSICGFGVVVL